MMDGGKVIPSAFAVLRLTTSSNLAGSSTGRSPRSLACQCPERGVQVIRHANLDRNKLAPKRGGRSLGISPVDCMRGTADVQQHPDSGGAWQHFERQLHLLSWQAVHAAQYASHLASRPGNARHKTKTLRICRIARMAGALAHTITSGISRTNSSASFGIRARSPSANRYTKSMFWPST
jgi:hypothetical protein